MRRTAFLPLAMTMLSALSAPAGATAIVTASLYSPTVLSNPTLIATPGAPTYAMALSGSGYSVTFDTPANQGVVQGASAGVYAIPVAGTSNGQATYLTGGYGSATTTDASQSGTYFSTGIGSITVSFATPETAISLLWGSIDTYNAITLGNGDVITGGAVQQAASGFSGSGYQGPGGSAYVTINSDTPFSSFIASSTGVSFEFGGVVGAPMAIGVAEPATLGLLGCGLATILLLRRRRA